MCAGLLEHFIHGFLIGVPFFPVAPILLGDLPLFGRVPLPVLKPLQLSLFVNNVPYNLEFFVGASYDRPGKDDMDEMKRLFEDAGLRYRQDLTLQKLFQKMGSRRFDSYAISEEADVDIVMKNAFVFAEISDLEKKGYGMSPFGKEKQVFISHSSKDKEEVEKLIPYLNGAGLPVWFDKYSIHVGDSIVDKVQEGLDEAESVIFWITEHFLDSSWCRYEMSAFIKKLIEENALIISILDKNIEIRQLPLFLRDIKAIYNNGQGYESLSGEIISAVKERTNL